LPAPERRPMAVEPLVRRVATLENRLAVELPSAGDCPDVVIEADRAQLEQLLINLVKNAVEAALENDGTVAVTWRQGESSVDISVLDTGPGLAATHNLFVPFFTTKPGGSGIGLVLCRQIAEAHGGSLTLENRTDVTSGCIARLRLPV